MQQREHQHSSQATSTEALQKAQSEISLGLADVSVASDGTITVKKVKKFSSAGKAGIAIGDQILSMNGAKCATPEAMWTVIANAGLGSTVDVRLMRNGQELSVPMKLIKRRQLNLEVDEVDAANLERKIAL